jgi:hypothetical protein
MMKKNRPMSSRMRRLAGAWAPYYRERMSKPQRGIITYGGGINLIAWIEDAWRDGYTTELTPFGVVLR